MVGRDKMYHAPNAPTARMSPATQGLLSSNAVEPRTKKLSIETETNLALRGMLPVRSQFLRAGPNHLWLRSQTSNRLLPLLKQ
ncbi:MAG: hypothetical protein KF884_00560 [Fimbriimonadaceae bacterium]|nr:hypothetical protein [Fimbriimonadaceae bacterium]QYK59739.1 MAG: hypothetical protein KF884_00560 [Fimbriimonadaceae bacterium]